MNDEYKWKLGYYREKFLYVKIVNFYENRII